MNLATILTIGCISCAADRGGAANTASAGAIAFMLILLLLVFGGVFQFMRYLCRCERGALEAAGKQDN
mgnify:CR=1 FL=1